MCIFLLLGHLVIRADFYKSACFSVNRQQLYLYEHCTANIVPGYKNKKQTFSDFGSSFPFRIESSFGQNQSQ